MMQATKFKVQGSSKLQISNFKQLNFDFWILNFKRLKGVSNG